MPYQKKANTKLVNPYGAAYISTAAECWEKCQRASICKGTSWKWKKTEDERNNCFFSLETKEQVEQTGWTIYIKIENATDLVAPIGLIKEGERQIYAEKNWPTAGELLRILQPYETPHQFIHSNKMPDPRIFGVALYLLRHELCVMENAYANMHIDAAGRKSNPRSKRETAMVLEQWMGKIGLSHIQLAEVLSKAIGHSFAIQVIFRSKAGDFNQASLYPPTTGLTWLDPVCFRLRTRQLGIESTEDQIHFSVNSFSQTRTHPIIFEFGSHPYVTASHGGQFDGLAGETKTVTVDIRSHYRALAASVAAPGQKRCSESSDLVQWRAECRIQMIYGKCQCIPFSWALAYKETRLGDWMTEYGSQVCSAHKYSGAIIHGYNDSCSLSYDGTEDAQCEKQCLRSCDLWTYQIVTKRAYTPVNSEKEKFTLIYNYGSLVYPKFEEYVSYTFQNLMGDLGGTIGLWMGASFLSIIHVLIFFAKRFRNDRNGPKTVTGENRHNPA